METTLSRDEYTIGWICALPIEYAAARQMLDERHEEAHDPSPNERDDNHYTLGSIGRHNVVIGVLPSGEYGTAAASSVATNLVSSFPSVRVGLMVGIGGGAPLKGASDIRLGDVVVSNPDNGYSGVMQYDAGKNIQDKGFQPTRVLNQPPVVLRTALAGLRARFAEEPHGFETLVSKILENNRRLKKQYQKPDSSTDMLFRPDLLHSGGQCKDSCLKKERALVSRPDRGDEDDEGVQIHYGLIATANTLMRNALERDHLAETRGILCFEMEAGGLMNSFPCLVIRGICDYSDTHKNKHWQGFAAMVAAAFARALTLELRPSNVDKESKVSDVITSKLEQLQGLAERMVSDKESDALHRWLTPSDPSTNYAQAIHMRHGKSGQWFLDSNIYKSWKTQPGGSLWLEGKPSCGKTVLSATVIKDLQEATPANGVLLYFYFDFRDSKKRGLKDLLSSFLYQIGWGKDERNPLRQLYRSCKDGKAQPNVTEMTLTLLSLIYQLSSVTIVLDALDEAQGRTSLLAWIADIHKKAPQVCLLSTSRPEYEIEASMCLFSKAVSVEGVELNRDILLYVKDRVRNDASLSRWRQMTWVQDEIEATLVHKADGMFQWVCCQLDSLAVCLSYCELQKTLRTLPETLDETYSRIWGTIPSVHRQKAITILQFLFIYGSRSVAELVDVISVSLDRRPRFDWEYCMPNPREILRYCSGLVSISPGGRRHGQVEMVAMSHASVMDWLVSARSGSGISQHFQEAQAHAAIAQVYLAIILDIPLALSGSEARRKHPLFTDAVLQWPYHARKGQVVAEVSTMAVELFKKRPYHSSYDFLLDMDWVGFYVDDMDHHPLYLAIKAGLVEVVRQLLHDGADINASSTSYGHAFIEASAHDHRDVVELLLEKGAAASISSRDLSSALYAASFFGNEDVVKLLLDSGAEVCTTHEASRGLF